MENNNQNWDKIVRVEDNGHLAEGKILQHLIKDMIQDQAAGYSTSNEETIQNVVINNGNGLIEVHKREPSNNEQLQTMIENYRNHVIKQQHQNKLAPKNYAQHRAYSTTANNNIQNGNPTNLMSHSQPCLFSAIPNGEHNEQAINDYSHYQHLSDPRDENNLINNNNSLHIVMNSKEVVLLRNEIIYLKKQTDLLQKKTDRLKQLEIAYGKIEAEFEQVLIQREKQENLEKAALTKMEQQIHRLCQENTILQSENARIHQFLISSDEQKQHGRRGSNAAGNIEQENSDAEKQVIQLNMILSEILPKNKELVSIQERLKIECEAQSTTLEEQRTHIEMLEKALANAQERIAAKDRQAIDAVAIVDKCSHLQKLLQEALDDKQKRQEEHNKQKSQLEMELAQMRMQMAKDHSNFGPRKGAKSPENEEIVKLKKTIYSKDERISQLENNLLEIQKRYNDELQRNDSVVREESDALLLKMRNLEMEKTEKERRIQELLDEKQRIHVQWADERHSLDHRVRMLEQDLRHLVVGGSQKFPSQTNTTQSYAYHPSTLYYSGDYFGPAMSGSVTNLSGMRQKSHTELPTSVKAALWQDSTMVRMEELKKKMADRRASSGSWVGRNKVAVVRGSNEDIQKSPATNSKYSSSASLHSHSSSNSDVALRNPVSTTGELPLSSASPTPSRMNSHMPPIDHFIDAQSSSARRRFGVPYRVTGHSDDQHIPPPSRDRSADARAMFYGSRDRSVNERLPVFTRNLNLMRGVLPLEKPPTEKAPHPKKETLILDSAQKPPLNGISKTPTYTSTGSSTTVVEVNRDHLKVENSPMIQKASAGMKNSIGRRSSLGSFSSTSGEN